MLWKLHNVKKTLDNKIIVTMGGLSKKQCFAQQAALTLVTTAISAIIARILYNVIEKNEATKEGCLIIVITHFAVALIFSGFNFIINVTGGHRGRWVQLSEKEITKRGIDKNQLREIDWSARIYMHFGSAPEWHAGQLTDFSSDD